MLVTGSPCRSIRVSAAAGHAPGSPTVTMECSRSDADLPMSTPLAPREVSPGIHLLDLPLPFELAQINVYLVNLPDGYLLIDCGLKTRASLDALSAGIHALGADWRSIRQILLTHIHPDHIGLAPRLLELTGARLIMHAD